MPQLSVFLVFASAHFLSNFVRMANAVIAEDLQIEFAIGPAELGWMTSLFFLTFAAAQLPFGWAVDRFGARLVTPLLMLVSVAGSLVFATATSVAALTWGRALMGLGTAGILMGGLKALSTWFDVRRFAFVSGALVAIGSSGGLLAATPLAWMTEAWGWRTVFVMGAGALLLSASMLAIWGRAGAQRAATAPGDSPGGFGTIFASGRFWQIAFLAMATTGVGFAYQSLWAGPYLREGIGLSTIAAGNVLLAFGIGVSVGYLALGSIGERFGTARTAFAAGVVFALMQVLLGMLPAPGAGLLLLIFLVLGAASSASGLLYSLARSLFPLALTGRAVTAVNLVIFAGGFALQGSLGLWLEAGLGGYGSLFMLTTTLTVLAALVFIPEARRRIAHH